MKPKQKSRLAIERLEQRSLPATFFLSAFGVFNSDGSNAEDTASEQSARLAAGVNSAILMRAGDRLVFDANDDLKFNPQERLLLSVAAGQSMVFFKEGFGPVNGAFDVNEISGLAVSDGFRGSINTDVQGSIATTLNAAGELQTTALQNSSIAGVTIAGRVLGSIVAGKDIRNVSIGSGLFTVSAERSVSELRTGLEANSFKIGYGKNSFTLAYSQPAGLAGGSISNVKLSNGALAVRTGKGGAVISGAGNGGNGGSITGLTIVDSPNALTIATGSGGDTPNGKGGAGGNILRARVAMSPVNTETVSIATGNGGGSTNGSGGAGGSMSASSITVHTDAENVFVRMGRGGSAGGAGSTDGAGGSIRDSSVVVGGSVGRVADGAVLVLVGGRFEVAAGEGGGGGVSRAGAGGSIINSRILAVNAQESIGFVNVVAGNGAGSTANFGGDGGDLRGNTVIVNSEVGFDVTGGRAGGVSIEARSGGDSATAAGKGGAIVNNTIRFSGPIELPSASSVAIFAGTSGNISSVSQKGLRVAPGGAITNLTAEFGPTFNPIVIAAGNGGNGFGQLNGAAGGSIRKLSFLAVDDIVRLNVLAGQGGNADGDNVFAGRAGSGGVVADSTITARVLTDGLLIRGGAGGASTASKIGFGGAGGGITNVKAAIAGIAAGGSDLALEGGDGLQGATAGGAGGGVSGVTLFAGQLEDSASDVVVKAGQGAGVGSSKIGNGGAGGAITNAALILNGPVGGAVELLAGNGGVSGSVKGRGGPGGRVNNLNLKLAGLDRLNVQSGGGNTSRDDNGAPGGDLSAVTIHNVGPVISSLRLIASEGSSAASGTGVGGAGGSISGVTIVNSGDIGLATIEGGNGGNGGGSSAAGNSGGVANVKVENHGRIGELQLLTANGGISSSVNGGSGGNINGVTFQNAVEGSSLVLIAGAGSFGGLKGGNGGNISGVTVSGPGTSVAANAGLGGNSTHLGGNGGNINGFTGSVHDAFFDAGDGGNGNGSTGKGGNGGSVSNITASEVGQAVWRVLGGNGGNGTLLGGNGGSVARVFVAGDLGGFDFDFSIGRGLKNVQGGLIAGQAGAGGAAVNGSVANVSAERISNILAGRPDANALTAANAVFSVTNIKAFIIGADVAADGDFDFTDAGAAGFNLGDGDTALDGLVIVRKQSDLVALPVAPLKAFSLIA